MCILSSLNSAHLRFNYDFVSFGIYIYIICINFVFQPDSSVRHFAGPANGQGSAEVVAAQVGDVCAAHTAPTYMESILNTISLLPHLICRPREGVPIPNYTYKFVEIYIYIHQHIHTVHVMAK